MDTDYSFNVFEENNLEKLKENVDIEENTIPHSPILRRLIRQRKNENWAYKEENFNFENKKRVLKTLICNYLYCMGGE